MNILSTSRLATFFATFLSSTAVVAVDSEDSLTIYSSLRPGGVPASLYRPVDGHNTGGNIPGFAIVRHDREYRIDKGTSNLRVADVAALIDPTTVTFRSLDEADTRVLEQSFQYDLVSQQKLLQKFIGEHITIEQVRGDNVDLLEGTLLSAADGLTLQMEDGSIRAVRSWGNIHFPELPGGLITRPTLEWLLTNPKAGNHNTRIAYETGGMTWWADYNLIHEDKRGCRLDLSAWVTIVNQSGAGYQHARLKLIAGDVNRAQQPGPKREVMMRAMAMEDVSGFTEKEFFEYHLYTLGRRTDLPDRSTRQIELIPATREIECERELVFAPTLGTPWWGYNQLDQSYGRGQKADVEVRLRFRNETGQGLGIPLPAGRIRVSQLDKADGSLEFIGEDVVDHTPKDEEVLIRMGNAFDVVGERKQTDFRIDTRTRNLWEAFEIRLRNHKSKAVDVIVAENLYRAANWRVENQSHEFNKENSNQIRFDVNVPSDGETVIRYTVHYSW